MAINISVDGMSYKGISSINYKGNIITLSEADESSLDKDKMILAANCMLDENDESEVR
jgi:hypothetical protein